MISSVKVLITVLGAEIDNIAPPELLKQYDKALTSIPKVGRSNPCLVLFLIFLYPFLYASLQCLAVTLFNYISQPFLVMIFSSS